MDERKRSVERSIFRRRLAKCGKAARLCRIAGYRRELRTGSGGIRGIFARAPRRCVEPMGGIFYLQRHKFAAIHGIYHLRQGKAIACRHSKQPPACGSALQRSNKSRLRKLYIVTVQDDLRSCGRVAPNAKSRRRRAIFGRRISFCQSVAARVSLEGQVVLAIVFRVRQS